MDSLGGRAQNVRPGERTALVALYEYRCPTCSDFEATFPMGAAPDTLTCPRCRSNARRRISAPRLSRTGTAAFRLIDSTKRSAYEPDVVTSRNPGSGRGKPRTSSANPLHQKLPRP
ncbi:zinc ribbon domain-containing protein [Arthrobacter sp. SW1]|uniref:FmdB family zinc ribbon protein n=1 Tax=Arthrobacter sp. SW1 TaxID=1920889 RepID=UPI0009F655EB|nr:zinc ribbon domain-containing protein [Arthrobacter sp. SW1]